MPLKVERSWSWRTWGYTTVRAGDVGEVKVEIIDDAGSVLSSSSLPIKKATAK